MQSMSHSTTKYDQYSSLHLFCYRYTKTS